MHTFYSAFVQAAETKAIIMSGDIILCTDTTQIVEYINSEPAVMVYFSHEECNVCKVLRPKVEEMLRKGFPDLKMMYCDTVKYPEIAAQRSIFAVPTILIFFDGREYIRKSRNISIEELYTLIERPYNMMFSD
jgi:thioredoxin 1